MYWHLQQHSAKVKIGDKVWRGNALALTGNTGNSSTAHIHFDVRSGWNDDYGRLNWNEFPSLPVLVRDVSHSCWVPRVGDALTSDNR